MSIRFAFGLFSATVILGSIVLIAASTQAGATAGLSTAIPEPVWGADIRVNPTIEVERSAHRNFSLAVNPTNPNIVMAGYDDTDNANGVSGHAWSTDAGRTWTGGIFTGPWGPDDKIPGGNTSVDFDSDGLGYYTSIGIQSQSFSYFILTTTNGLDWSTPVPIITSPYEEFRYYSYLAVDHSSSGPNAGSLYLSWLYTSSLPPYQRGITMRYSRDSGRTWSNDISISDPDHAHSSFSQLVVAPNGAIYAAFPYIQDSFVGNAPHLYLDRSTDGGLTWGPDRLISGAPIDQIGGFDWKKRERVLIGSALCSQMRMHHYPSIAVSPADPATVYAVWNDARWERTITDCDLGGKHSDIAFSRTTDAGLTWSPVIRLNDDAQSNGVDQFLPTITTHSSGLIGVTWQDRRYGDGHQYDMAYAQSTDGGLSWSKNQRVSDLSSNPDSVPDYKGIDYLGYRFPLVFGPDYVLPGWLDTRRGDTHGDFYTDRGTLPTATPTVSTGTATSTRLPTQITGGPTATLGPPHTATATSIPSLVPSHTPAEVTPPATFVPTTTPCTLQFSDVPESNSFYAFLRCLACRGIISGYSDGTFRPNAEISRGQIAKMVSNSAGFGEDPGAQIYDDVPPASPFYSWINRLSMRGHMGGYNCDIVPEEPCGTGNRPYFRPSASATRGQLAKIVANAAELGGTPSVIFYTDVQEDNPFYVWIMRLTTLNVMSGYTCGGPNEPCDASNRPYFRPFNTVTRGQASKIVANTFFPGCQTPR